MRAVEIALLIILLQGSIGFVNGVGLFDDPFYATQESAYTDFVVEEDLAGFTNVSTEMSGIDYFTMSVGLLRQGLILFAKVVFSIVLIYPTLVGVFGIPSMLSAFLQLGIYVTYIIGYVQFITNRSMKGME